MTNEKDDAGHVLLYLLRSIQSFGLPNNQSLFECFSFEEEFVYFNVTIDKR